MNPQQSWNPSRQVRPAENLRLTSHGRTTETRYSNQQRRVSSRSSPRKQEFDLRRRKLSPKRRKFNPKRREFYPEEAEIRKYILCRYRYRSCSPQRRELNSRRRNISPQKQEFKPRRREFNPPAEDFISHIRHITRRSRRVNPLQGERYTFRRRQNPVRRNQSRERTQYSRRKNRRSQSYSPLPFRNECVREEKRNFRQLNRRFYKIHGESPESRHSRSHFQESNLPQRGCRMCYGKLRSPQEDLRRISRTPPRTILRSRIYRSNTEKMRIICRNPSSARLKRSRSVRRLS
ncbi:hypothetical protein Bhyg_17901 [Pseudolycoriella hygida]|uniref:Uncharacterized protein n=1 Tax=Pseudolycoriella hygida TaxID=35572 RepID=A0A9Q0MJW7_9DIPT|nr:hypothetical protein Bhyg_17901 [Pseudolycoriella hygida]